MIADNSVMGGISLKSKPPKQLICYSYQIVEFLLKKENITTILNVSKIPL